MRVADTVSNQNFNNDDAFPYDRPGSTDPVAATWSKIKERLHQDSDGFFRGYHLSVDSGNLASNVTVAIGPALGLTTDGKFAVLAEGGGIGDWQLLMQQEAGEFLANITLADASAVVLPVGTLGMNNGQLVMGNGVTTGGVPIGSQVTDIPVTGGTELVGTGLSLETDAGLGPAFFADGGHDVGAGWFQTVSFWIGPNDPLSPPTSFSYYRTPTPQWYDSGFVAIPAPTFNAGDVMVYRPLNSIGATDGSLEFRPRFNIPASTQFVNQAFAPNVRYRVRLNFQCIPYHSDLGLTDLGAFEIGFTDTNIEPISGHSQLVASFENGTERLIQSRTLYLRSLTRILSDAPANRLNSDYNLKVVTGFMEFEFTAPAGGTNLQLTTGSSGMLLCDHQLSYQVVG